MSRRRLGILAAIVALPVAAFLVIQLIPVWLLQTNPPVLAEPKWDSAQTRALAQRACFDCHSNETKWPLYARIAPVSWLVTFDTLRGRRALNFSEWGSARGERDDEMTEVVSNGQMPPASYLWLHPEAQLTDAEQEQLIRGLLTFTGAR